jgi:deoxyribose-phosphate aldolase
MKKNYSLKMRPKSGAGFVKTTTGFSTGWLLKTASN